MANQLPARSATQQKEGPLTSLLKMLSGAKDEAKLERYKALSARFNKEYLKYKNKLDARKHW